jgi:hypothetical protein
MIQEGNIGAHSLFVGDRMPRILDEILASYKGRFQRINASIDCVYNPRVKIPYGVGTLRNSFGNTVKHIIIGAVQIMRRRLVFVADC